MHLRHPGVKNGGAGLPDAASSTLRPGSLVLLLN